MQGNGADEAAAPPIAKLPLQVGSTANFRVPGASMGVFLGAVLIAGPLTQSSSFDGYDLGTLLFGVLFAVYGTVRAYGAIKMRASDLILEPDGLQIEGGPHGGTRISWSELREPFARVEGDTELQLNFWRILYYVPMALFLFLPLKVFPAISLRSKTKIWRLWVFRRGPKGDEPEQFLVAKTEREIEARSMEAAASSIAAIEEGRRYVEQAPAVQTEIVQCPACGAPAVLDDADQVPCRYCGAAIPLPDHVREQAAATRVAQHGRTRSNERLRKLLSQPRAFRTNLWLSGLWTLVLASLPVSMGAAAVHFDLAYKELQGPEGWLAERPWLLLLAPFVVMLSSYVFGRARLVNRGAMQILTLGFGALAPARDGDPSRCRRCHAPLPDVEMGGVTACGYCHSDNIVGIDLRPLVDKARAEQQSVDRVLEERRRSKWSWSTAAVLATLCLSGTAAGVSDATVRLLAFERDKQQSCDAGRLDACRWLFVRHRDDGYYQRPCDAGHAEACALLGDVYVHETWRDGNMAKAAALYERACDGEFARACYELGLLHHKGRGMEEAPAKAVAFYERACDGESMNGCINLANLYAQGHGELGEGREAKVLSLYERACERGHSVGCYNLALQHEHGEGTARDFARAAEYYGRACELGDDDGCTKQEKMDRAVRLQDPEVRQKFEQRVERDLEEVRRKSRRDLEEAQRKVNLEVEEPQRGAKPVLEESDPGPDGP